MIVYSNSLYTQHAITIFQDSPTKHQILLLILQYISDAKNPDPPSDRGLRPAFAALADDTYVTTVLVALVSGKSIEELASEKGVAVATVEAALDAAYKVDVEKATQDGIYNEPADVVIAEPSTDPIPGVPGNDEVTITISHMGGRGLVSAHNVVQPMIVAGEALSMSCADLVKATRDSGTSVVQVAADRGVSIQTLVDALVKAYQDATAKDVEEGLITEAQATAHNRNLVQRVTQMISMPGGMMIGGKFGIEMGAIRIGRPGKDVIGGSGPGWKPGRGDSKQPPTPQSPEVTPEATPNA